jgi:hypothetical protein
MEAYMHLKFQISCQDIGEFVNHWSSKYNDPLKKKYDNYIGKPLTEESRQSFFEWKNGGSLSKAKLASIQKNYPLWFEGNTDAKEERYLKEDQEGGPIWNIFYLHCLEPKKWPIFDQHTFRAMRYIKAGRIVEIGKKKKQIYQSYREYLKFLKAVKSQLHKNQPCKNEVEELRKLDKAFYAFGKFLKTADKYL